MKFRFLILACCIGIFIASIITGVGADHSDMVYSKTPGLALRESPDPTASVKAKAEWNEELSVLEQKKKWLKVRAADGEGWVYVGNISTEKLPAENKNDLPIKASGLTATAASRALTDKAEEYADRHSEAEVAEQLKWAEKINREIDRDQVKSYLKEKKLGEYAQ